MTALIRKAMALNDEGVTVERAPRARRTPARMPPDLAAALQKHQKAKRAFDAFSPSHRRAYIEWITEAKREATHQRRIETALRWIAAGKSRNWKSQPTRT